MYVCTYVCTYVRTYVQHVFKMSSCFTSMGKATWIDGSRWYVGDYICITLNTAQVSRYRGYPHALGCSRYVHRSRMCTSVAPQRSSPLHIHVYTVLPSGYHTTITIYRMVCGHDSPPCMVVKALYWFTYWIMWPVCVSVIVCIVLYWWLYPNTSSYQSTNRQEEQEMTSLQCMTLGWHHQVHCRSLYTWQVNKHDNLHPGLHRNWSAWLECTVCVWSAYKCGTAYLRWAWMGHKD